MFDAVDVSNGESWMRWTIRLAAACVYLRFLVRLRTGAARSSSPLAIECWLWTIGLLTYLFHIALAFQFVHHWSHNEAWRHTAEETARLTGFYWGAGVWANYAFTLIWACDAVRIDTACLRRRPTSRWLDWASLIVFAFMFVNATMVFGPAHYRWLAIPAVFALMVAWRIGRKSLPPAIDADLSNTSVQ